MPPTARKLREPGPGEVGSSVSDAATAYVPRILVESLIANPDREMPWFEWVDGTLVMADVSGFTALSERLAQAGKEGAEWLTEIINRYFGRMLDIAWGCGGTTLTFGGDAILLLFYGEDHERRGVAAALRMLHGTDELPAYSVGRHRVKLAMSMGAHAGRFLMASAGTAESAQYFVLGPETVKTAQAEARASSGQLAVTPALVERIGRHLQAEPLDEYFHVTGLVDTPRYSAAPSATGGAIPAAKLAAYLPPSVADALRSDPDGPVPTFEHEHRNVTIDFVNVLGVDDILATDGPDALVDELQRHLEPVLRLLRANQGYLVSNDIYLNGFKLIVGFGVPAAHEHDAENAFRFAASLRDEIAAAGLRLTHRIGINGGFVFAGDVGPLYRRQYTIMGDAVNLSARLMGAAAPGQIIVSAPSAEAAGNCFLVRELEPIRVKGKEQPVAIGLLEGECEPPVDERREQAPFFGRERELARLDEALEDAERGRGRVVLIRGEAGIGKSRLAGEFERHAADRGWTVRIGRAYEHTSGQPFAPWLPVLEAVLGLSADDDTDARSAKTLEAVQDAGADLVEWASLLDPLLRLTIPQTPAVRRLSSTDRRNRMFDLIARVLAHAAAGAPLLMHLEDLHRADASSVDLLERLALDVSRSRLLLLATERPGEAREPTVPEGDLLEIDLAELESDAALALVRDALGLELTGDAAAVLLEKTRGNPLFLEEVARSVTRSGIGLGAADDGELARRLRDIEVPDQVQGLLMSSIDALPAAEKDVLRMASVLGTRFEISTLRGSLVVPEDAAGLERCISDLVGQSVLLESASAAERTYEFRHALVQEVAYESLPFSRRRTLHCRVGNFLEDSHRGSLDEVCESLVHHFRLGGDRPKTAVYAVRAGQKALALLAPDAAIDYFTAGTEAVRARTPGAAFARSYLVEQIGDCYDQTGRHALAANSYRQALERSAGQDQGAAMVARSLLALPEAPPTTARAAELSFKVGSSYTRTHRDYARSLTWFDRAARLLPPRHVVLGASIEQKRGVALMWTGAHQDAIACERRALRVARRVHDRDLEARAATTLAVSYAELGDCANSIRYDSLALEANREISNLRGEAESHANLAADHSTAGIFGTALEHAREALRIYERTGDLTATAITRCNVGEILVIQGAYDEAADELPAALGLLERAGGASGTIAAFALMNLARACAGRGELDEAAALLEDADARQKRAGSTTLRADIRVAQAELAFAAGDATLAAAECERALADAREFHMRMTEIRALRLRGRIAASLGDLAAAEADLRESAEMARRASAPFEQGLALLELAEAYAADGRPYRRLATFALRLLEPTQATRDIERARALVGGG